MDALVAFARWLTEGQTWTPLIVGALIKSTLLLAVAGLASILLRRASASARHAVWTAAVIGSLALPALQLSLPSWRVPILPADPTAQASAAPDEGPSVGSAAAPRVREDESPNGEEASSVAGGATRPTDRSPASDLRALVSAVLPSSSTLLAVWAGGALVLLLRIAIGHVKVRRLAVTPPDAVSWLEVARETAKAAGLTRMPRFVEGPEHAMPMTWGVFRPVVMIPACRATWPVSRLRVVLLHEFAHVERRDCLTQTLANLGCALYWFNPMSWLAAARLTAERERACDDWVLAAGTDGPEYAEQLLDIARAMRPSGMLSWSTVSMARRSQLEGRLLAILDPDVSRRPPTRAVAAAVVAVLALVVPLLAAVQPAPAPHDGPAGASAPPAALLAGTPGSVIPLDVFAPSDPPNWDDQAPTPTPTPTPRPTPQPATSADVKPSTAGDDASDRDEKRPVDPKVVEALTAALKDPDKDVRRQALFTLGQLRAPMATGALAALLLDADADVREQAAFALGQTRDPAAVEPLVGVLRDTVPDVREQAVFALSQIRDGRAVEPIMALTTDPSADVREKACFALAQFRDRRATPRLIAALSDESPDVREQAAFALGQLRDPAAAEALAARLTDPKPDVREMAVFALGQLRDPRAVEPLIKALDNDSTEVQEHAALALGQLRDRRAVPALLRALRSASTDVREQAAMALGQIGDPSTVEALTAALKDESPEVRRAAAFALAQAIEHEP